MSTFNLDIKETPLGKEFIILLDKSSNKNKYGLTLTKRELYIIFQALGEARNKTLLDDYETIDLVEQMIEEMEGYL